jgi:hypothetical protein
MTTLAANTTPTQVGNANVDFTISYAPISANFSIISESNIVRNGILEHANIKASSPITNFDTLNTSVIKTINVNSIENWFTLIGNGSENSSNTVQTIELIIS